jgi:metal-responsive CopG/Arc/MetJ family transcriptional regulator
MRLHIRLEDELDARVGRRERSSFIARTIRRALEDERRWDDSESAPGGLAEGGHAWDADPGQVGPRAAP